MRRKYLYISYRSRERPTKQCQAKMTEIDKYIENEIMLNLLELPDISINTH